MYRSACLVSKPSTQYHLLIIFSVCSNSVPKSLVDISPSPSHPFRSVVVRAAQVQTLCYGVFCFELRSPLSTFKTSSVFNRSISPPLSTSLQEIICVRTLVALTFTLNSHWARLGIGQKPLDELDRRGWRGGKSSPFLNWLSGTSNLTLYREVTNSGFILRGKFIVLSPENIYRRLTQLST